LLCHQTVDLKAFQAIVKQVESFWFTVVSSRSTASGRKNRRPRDERASHNTTFKLLLVEDNLATRTSRANVWPIFRLRFEIRWCRGWPKR